jgi:hypothetical protein
MEIYINKSDIFVTLAFEDDSPTDNVFVRKNTTRRWIYHNLEVPSQNHVSSRSGYRKNAEWSGALVL